MYQRSAGRQDVISTFLFNLTPAYRENKMQNVYLLIAALSNSYLIKYSS